jgi:hypothetical protein
VKLALRYLMASSGFANCAAAGSASKTESKAETKAKCFFMHIPIDVKFIKVSHDFKTPAKCAF